NSMGSTDGGQITKFIFAIATSKISPKKIIGIDISVEMLKIGREKIKKKGLAHLITLYEGDAENLSFPDNEFDAITVAFGVRNFENINKGLAELYRVLKPGGRLIVLEFSKPKSFPVKQFYNIYFTRLLPFVGKMFSKDYSAYTYLPESVGAFPERDQFLDLLDQAKFTDNKYIPLSFGIAMIYVAHR
ncbi:ubiquinone/menaquinone biosynthesis methyltransferase, partial [Bacteroidota bacterium]